MKVKITILILFFFNAFANAQQSIDISYGQQIDLGEAAAHSQFLITDAFSKTTKIKGDKINSYAFEKPGIYHIKVTHPQKDKDESCDHGHLPGAITVNVSRVKMDFVADRIRFSSPVLKNKETNGIKISIPIQIQTYDHQPVELNTDPVNTAGIGSTIVARLDKDYGKLAEGEHTITYNLSGIAHENAYLMFDFIDANGKIQPVALTQPVTNQR